MESTPVQSSNIAAIGYEAEGGTLQVTFHNASRFLYRGVPQEEYDALMASASKGSYFARQIRAKYPAEKVG